jgi:IS30 family transposase
MAGIPEKYRKKIYNLRSQGKTADEISDELSISLATIRRHVDQAKTRDPDYVPPLPRGGRTIIEPSEEKLRKAFELRRTGASEQHIAKHVFNTTSKANVTDVLEKNKEHPLYHPKNNLNPKHSPETLAAIHSGLDAKQSFGQIAKRLNVPRGTVARLALQRKIDRQKGTQEMKEDIKRMIRQVIMESKDEDLKIEAQKRANVSSGRVQTHKQYMKAYRDIANRLAQLEDTHGLPVKSLTGTHAKIIELVDEMQRKLSTTIGEQNARSESDKKTVRGLKGK